MYDCPTPSKLPIIIHYTKHTIDSNLRGSIIRQGTPWDQAHSRTNHGTSPPPHRGNEDLTIHFNGHRRRPNKFESRNFGNSSSAILGPSNATCTPSCAHTHHPYAHQRESDIVSRRSRHATSSAGDSKCAQNNTRWAGARDRDRQGQGTEETGHASPFTALDTLCSTPAATAVLLLLCSALRASFAFGAHSHSANPIFL